MSLFDDSRCHTEATGDFCNNCWSEPWVSGGCLCRCKLCDECADHPTCDGFDICRECEGKEACSHCGGS